MSLTQTQLLTFKAAINADATALAMKNAGNTGGIATYYNQTNGVDKVWRPDLSIGELNTAIVWSEFISFTVAKQNGYFAMTQGGNVDATSTNIRNGFTSIFTGTTSLTNLTALAARLATRFEVVFGTLATNYVSTMYGYLVTDADVVAAINAT